MDKNKSLSIIYSIFTIGLLILLIFIFQSKHNDFMQYLSESGILFFSIVLLSVVIGFRTYRLIRVSSRDSSIVHTLKRSFYGPSIAYFLLYAFALYTAYKKINMPYYDVFFYTFLYISLQDLLDIIHYRIRRNGLTDQGIIYRHEFIEWKKIDGYSYESGTLNIPYNGYMGFGYVIKFKVAEEEFQKIDSFLKSKKGQFKLEN